ncbi:MAG: lytic transglycosylase domain-containing protein [Methanobacteriota archaeon]|nr:MAG: lytic transglycosylase domain-containing protein [Euryarchaeota archaeon]
MDNIKLPLSPADALVKQKAEELSARSKNKTQLQKASEDFEALFVYFMLSSMRKTVMKSGLLDNGLGGEIYEAMLDQELSRTLAQHSQLGIAEVLQQQLSAQDHPSSGSHIRNSMPPIHPTKMKKSLNTYLQSAIPKRLKPYEEMIMEASQNHGVDANLIKAVIFAESSGNPEAVSKMGAKGLMQLMESTAEEVGVQNPFDPRENIQGGSRYLAKLLKRYKGDIQLALAAYNAGPTAVDKYGDIPPFPETQRYVEKVLRFYKMLTENS